MKPEPPIDLLMTLARFAEEQRMSLRDPKIAEAFLGVAKERLAEALANDALLYGQRTQNMFEALIVSLGQYKLLKTEDSGRVTLSACSPLRIFGSFFVTEASG